MHLKDTTEFYLRAANLSTPEFVINEKGEGIFEELRVTSPPFEVTSAYVYETLRSGDTIRLEQKAQVTFPDYVTSTSGGSLFMRNHDKLTVFNSFSDEHGGIIQSNGVQEDRKSLNSYWNFPCFTPRGYAHNRAQINVKPFTQGQTAFYEFDNVKNMIGTLRVLSDAAPYSILGQSGQCTADFHYQIQNNTSVFPSFSLLQVSVDGHAVDNVRPDQNGKVRLILSDPDSSITSATISLIPASGNEIALPVSSAGALSYDASIPSSLPTGFLDIVVRAEDKNGNRCEMTASPGFYFGSTIDGARPDARLRMNSYSLDSVESANMQAGDTLNYTLSYTNFGSDTARNVVVAFPTTPSFRPVGSQSWTKSSFAVNDTVHIPVHLVFLGKQNANDSLAYYSPVVSWTSGGTNYVRKHNVLVDFQSTITDVEQTSSVMPFRYELHQNYPNPFNPSTTIHYDLPKQSKVKMVVYDILGREVATLVNETKNAGSYQVIWNANRVASGVYFYRLQADAFTETKKLMIIK